ncbi:Uncharacterized protein LW94_6820 [Fusarium fujikuroi]|nr:Uncharacterized protein LW94_6820 [Fusarium fujikuroi]
MGTTTTSVEAAEILDGGWMIERETKEGVTFYKILLLVPVPQNQTPSLVSYQSIFSNLSASHRSSKKQVNRASKGRLKKHCCVCTYNASATAALEVFKFPICFMFPLYWFVVVPQSGQIPLAKKCRKKQLDIGPPWNLAQNSSRTVPTFSIPFEGCPLPTVTSIHQYQPWLPRAKAVDVGLYYARYSHSDDTYPSLSGDWRLRSHTSRPDLQFCSDCVFQSRTLRTIQYVQKVLAVNIPGHTISLLHLQLTAQCSLFSEYCSYHRLKTEGIYLKIQRGDLAKHITTHLRERTYYVVGEHLMGMISNCFSASCTYERVQGSLNWWVEVEIESATHVMVQLRHVRFLFTDRGALDSTPNCVDDIFEAPSQANQNRAWQLLASLPLEQKAPQVEDLHKALRSPHRMVWAREPLSNGYLDHCHCLEHLNILHRSTCTTRLLISRSMVRDIARSLKGWDNGGWWARGLEGQEQSTLQKTAALDSWLLTNNLAGTHREYQELPHILKFISHPTTLKPLSHYRHCQFRSSFQTRYPECQPTANHHQNSPRPLKAMSNRTYNHRTRHWLGLDDIFF